MFLTSCDTTGWRAAAGAVTALRFSRDGGLLASGSADTSLVVWDVVGEAGLCRFKGHKDAITDLVSDETLLGGGLRWQ